MLTSDKIDFKQKMISRDKNGYYIMIKGIIHQKDIIFINKYALNIEAQKYIKQL